MTDTMEARKVLEEEMRLRELFWFRVSSDSSVDNRIIAAALAAMSRFATSQQDAVIQECARDGFNIRDLVLAEVALEISSHVEAYEGHPSGKMFGDGWRAACEEMAEAVLAMRNSALKTHSPSPQSNTVVDEAAWRDFPVTVGLLADVFDAFCGADGHNLVVDKVFSARRTAALTPEGK